LRQELINIRKWWKKNKQHKAPTPRRNLYIERPEPQWYNTYFRVFVRNLPPEVDSIQLRKFFSHHGKVYNGKVMWKRKNKMSKKTGLVTIAMVEEWPDSLAVLNGLVSACVYVFNYAQVH
jgi:RNA recognition motif-containing protein